MRRINHWKQKWGYNWKLVGTCSVFPYVLAKMAKVIISSKLLGSSQVAI